jgi:hypothetical protein
MEWFGTGGKYTDAYSKTNLSFGGIQEPKIKYYLNLWETEGIGSWYEIEDINKKNVIFLLRTFH